MVGLLEQEGFGSFDLQNFIANRQQPGADPLAKDALPLDATAAPLVGSVADAQQLPVSPEEKGNKFRDFVLRAGGGRPSLLNTLSAAFGQGTEEIAARKRQAILQQQGDARQAVLDRISLAEAKSAEDALGAGTPRKTVKDANDRLRFTDGKQELLFPNLEVDPEPEGVSAFQEKVNAMVATGEVTENQAVGIAAGQLVTSRHPVTGEVEVVNKATGQVVGGEPTQSAPAAPQEQPAEKPTPDIREALGAAGFGQNIINQTVDMLGGDLPFPQAAEAAATLDNLNLKSIQLASGGIDGRPNVFFQEKVQGLLPQPNEIFTGAGKSLKRFEALTDMFKQESARIQSDIDTQKVQPETRDDAQKRVSELNSLAAEYDKLIASAKPKNLPPLESFLK